MSEHYGELRRIFGIQFNIQESSRRRDITFDKFYSPVRFHANLTIKPSQLNLLGKNLIDRLTHQVSEKVGYYINDWFVCGLLGSNRIEMTFELSKVKDRSTKSTEYKPKKLSWIRKLKTRILRFKLKRKGLMK